jgi:signal transduction histidine kinase
MQWEQTFDGIKDPIAIVDVDYSVVRANRHFPVLTRHGRIFETHCHRVFSETERPCSGCPVEFALKTRQPQRGQIRRGDQYFDVYSYPIQLNHDSVTTNVINHYVDVTKARELNGRMIQNEKMAAIGHLAGHIAHELNNPLTGIRSLAQVLMAEVPKTGSLHDDILEVEKASERSQKIIENLLAFSRGGTDQKQERIALNDIVRRTLPMLKTAMREHRSEVNLEANDAQVTVEPHLMQQVVFNLVNNACQAMPDIGSISLTTQVEYDSRGDWCVLKVSDTGTGIPQEIIDSIFEPFFTTKEQGRGTGLGLSMSRSVIEKFGGEIEVASTVGQGSTFIVRLPCVKEGPV